MRLRRLREERGITANASAFLSPPIASGTIDELESTASGGFFDFDGDALPWYRQPKFFIDNSIVNISNAYLKQANSKNCHHFFPKYYPEKQGEEEFYRNLLGVSLDYFDVESDLLGETVEVGDQGEVFRMEVSMALAKISGLTHSSRMTRFVRPPPGLHHGGRSIKVIFLRNLGPAFISFKERGPSHK